MKLIGLMMVCDEDDVLAESMANHALFCDQIYVLDGSRCDARIRTEQICRRSPVTRGYWRDDDTPYTRPLRDGARQFLLEQARKEHGIGNWYAILHGDEIWAEDPKYLVQQNVNNPIAYVIDLYHFFPHETEKSQWRFVPGETSIEQLSKWYMLPPVPENRLFYDSGRHNYEPGRHSRTVPVGLRSVKTSLCVKQYNYRSPSQAHLRAVDRRDREWQRNHYQHLLEGSDDFFRPTLASEDHQWAGLVPKGEGEAVNIMSRPLPTLRARPQTPSHGLQTYLGTCRGS